MAEVDWGEIQGAFERAIACDGSARDAVIATLARSDAEAAAVVAALVAAHEREPDFLETPIVRVDDTRVAAHDATADDATADGGRRIGPYRIERELGEGGMGVVYLATHEDGAFRRTVALKVAREEIASAYLTARFAAERDILARLSHPNIAHLYDGGLTAGGRPYLVMEYVDGTPITEHCARHALPLRDRLALVQAVCRAADYAHRHLVIHRDLKPSNILVTRDGVVKLLDFGVAKVLRPELPDEARRATSSGAPHDPPTVVALTPAYAAPEQLRRERVTTATDVYGVGLVAYELVAGARAHALDGLPLGEVERVVTETDPPPPTSVRVGAGTGRATRRRLTDVDHVILKALRREPEARYATPREFDEDLQRVLDGRPVVARAPTLRYRAARFVRRNRGRVAVVAAAVVALAGTAAVAVRQASVATAAAHRADAERAAAEAASARAQRINTFLQTVLATANPGWFVTSAEKGPDVTVLRALELAAARMERELADDPETRADIHHTLGETYRILGQSPKMVEQYERMIAIRERVYRPPHPKLADALFHLSIVRADQGRLHEGDSLAVASLAMQRLRDEGANLPFMLERVAAARVRGGWYAEAERMYAEGGAIARGRYGPDHSVTRSFRAQRAAALAALGRRSDARALAAALAAGGRDAHALLALASAAAADGDLARADTLFAARERLDSTGVVTPLDRVEAVLVPQRRWGEARAIVARVRDSTRVLLRRESPAWRPWVADGEALLAVVEAGDGRGERAVAEARGALATIADAHDDARSDRFWKARFHAHHVLARSHLAAGRPGAAEPLLRDNLRAVERRGLYGPLRDSTIAALGAVPALGARRVDAVPAGPSSSAASSSATRRNARANRQSRLAVATETPRTRAASSSDRPPK